MHLAKGGVVSVASGATIRVERGVLWVTQYPDRNDYFLRAGESMRLSRRSAALISGLHESVFRVIAAERAASRWWPLLRSYLPKVRPA
jgi:Protein of unknown function (DUF2917)